VGGETVGQTVGGSVGGVRGGWCGEGREVGGSKIEKRTLKCEWSRTEWLLWDVHATRNLYSGRSQAKARNIRSGQETGNLVKKVLRREGC